MSPQTTKVHDVRSVHKLLPYVDEVVFVLLLTVSMGLLWTHRTEIPVDCHRANETRDELYPSWTTDGFVSVSAELKTKSNPLNKWIERLTKKEVDYEIPSYPLDAQPDPERVTHIDVDLRNCTDAIKDQRRCGACYAFSWISLVEWHHCRQTRGEQRINLSEQHIVDCGQVARLRGCVEGKLSDARDFSQVFGLHLEQNYPYTGTQGVCRKGAELEAKKLKVKVRDFRRLLVVRENFERVLAEQPILLEVHLPADILDYSSGIHPGHNCDPERGHGMLLVGYGRQDGKPYWLLRNSMSRKWGENGYLRLARDMPDMKRCFRSAFVAKFRFAHLDEDNYVDFYDSLLYEPAVEQREKYPTLT